MHWILENGGTAYADRWERINQPERNWCVWIRFSTNRACTKLKWGRQLTGRNVDDFGGGFKEPVKAMHIGGPLGGMVPVSKIDDLGHRL